MAKLNIANMNTLFRKGYLLAVVMMAANIFIVNEMKASDIENGDTNKKEELLEIEEREKIIKRLRKKPEETNENKVGKKKKGGIGLKSFLGFLLSHENIINLFGGLAFSCVNNYFKLWDYNPGMYCKPVWLGWRSKRFLNGIFQFEVNLNVVRGILWLIPGAYNFIKGIVSEQYKGRDYFTPLHVSCLVADLINKDPWSTLAFIGVFLIQGFVSLPLTLHIFNFSISLSLDSIILAGVGKLLEAKIEKKKKKNAKDLEMAFIENKKKEDGNNNPEENTENDNLNDNINEIK